MDAVRDRRLTSDFAGMQALAAASAGRLAIASATGTPPTTYRLIFHCRSVTALNGDTAVFGTEHHVRIYLPARYPADGPVATMLSPAVHPHIWPNRTVCLGVWSPSEKLDSVVRRIGDLLIFAAGSLNWRSVADESAVPWARAHGAQFPLDAPLLPETLAAPARTRG